MKAIFYHFILSRDVSSGFVVTDSLAVKCELLSSSLNVINDDLYHDSRIRNTADFDLVERQTSDWACDK